jgi:hypothetical protein
MEYTEHNNFYVPTTDLSACATITDSNRAFLVTPFERRLDEAAHARALARYWPVCPGVAPSAADAIVASIAQVGQKPASKNLWRNADMNRLDGKVALLSGAARGIGAETARKMAAAGASVVLGDVLADRARETAKEITGAGGKALALTL